MSCSIQATVSRHVAVPKASSPPQRLQNVMETSEESRSLRSHLEAEKLGHHSDEIIKYELSTVDEIDRNLSGIKHHVIIELQKILCIKFRKIHH